MVSAYVHPAQSAFLSLAQRTISQLRSHVCTVHIFLYLFIIMMHVMWQLKQAVEKDTNEE